MELMARMQEIFGKKIFRDKIICKYGQEVYATPVAGEPSLGTLHYLQRNTTSSSCVINGSGIPAASTWGAAVDCSSYVPAGSKAILVRVMHSVVATNIGLAYSLAHYSDNDATTPSYTTHHPHTRVYFTSPAATTSNQVLAEIVIPLNSSLAFYVYGGGRTNINSHDLYVTILGYYI